MFGLSVATIIKIGGALVLVGLLWFGWHALTEHYEQIGKDSRNGEVKKLTTERDTSVAAERQREFENGQCVAATKLQSDAITAAQQRSIDAQAESRRLIAEGQAKAKAHAAQVSSWKTLAGAAPKLQSCEKELAEADAIVDESLRLRRAP